MININKTLKWKDYLKESLDPWKLKVSIKSFNRLKDDVLTIYGDLKDLSKSLTSEFKDIKLPYKKSLNFGGIDVDIIVIQSNRYYSKVDWNKFLKGDFEIVIEVIENYDTNYLISTIIHEIRHMIDFTDENLNSGLSSFDIDRNLRKFNIDNFNEFFILVYISLEHELVARNNQIYPYIKFKNLTKSESLDILKNSSIYKSLIMLREFDYQNFIKKFNSEQLINITNLFLKECLYDNDMFIESESELESFYKVWNEYFIEISNKWEKLLLNEVNKIWERTTNLNLENSNNWKDIQLDIWNKIKNNLRNE
jgi:hypothetical protein